MKWREATEGKHVRWGWLWVGLGMVGWMAWVGAAERDVPALESGRVPVGSMVAYGGGGGGVPEGEGWMVCDGRELTVQGYPELHAVLGRAWGGGAAGTFRLPDLRGQFLRGVQGEGSEWEGDPDAAERVASAPGGATGNEVGTRQADAVGAHEHVLAGVGDAVGAGGAAGMVRFFATKVPDEDAPLFFNSGSIQGVQAAETRPRNVSVHWIIRVR
jgi:microcystin-dependent protein